MKTRAIYIPGIEYNSMPIFELKQGKFVYITDYAIQYDAEAVVEDDLWLIITIEEDYAVIAGAKQKREVMRATGNW